MTIQLPEYPANRGPIAARRVAARQTLTSYWVVSR